MGCVSWRCCWCSDVRRSVNDAAYANSGSYCVRIRDNSGTASSFYSSNGFDISGYSQLMAEAESEEERVQMSDTIRRQVAHFNDMTRELLAFVRGGLAALPCVAGDQRREGCGETDTDGHGNLPV